MQFHDQPGRVLDAHYRPSFNGGKVINRSQSGSWEVRCSGAGLHANEGPGGGQGHGRGSLGKQPTLSLLRLQLGRLDKWRLTRRGKLPTKLSQADTHQSMQRQMTTPCGQGVTCRHDDGPVVQEVDSVLPQAYFQGQILDYYRANVNVTDSRIVEVERSTRGQGTATKIAGNLWLAERQ